MNKSEIVQTLMDIVQRGDLEHAKSMVAQDFQFRDLIPGLASMQMGVTLPLNWLSACLN